MAAPDKRDSRELRDLKQQGQAALTWGLANPVTEATVVGVALLVRDKLADKTAAGSAAAATDIATRMLDKSTAKLAAAGTFACTKGCNYCCHSVVSVSAPEVFRIANALTAAGGDVAALQARIKSRDGLDLDALLAKSQACPLLVDGDCSVHADRPLGCRQYFSASVEACRQQLEGKRGDAPFIAAAANVGLIARSVLLAAARSLGLRTDTYELASAMAVALATPDAERRWLAGENPLSTAMKMPQPPNMQASVDRWSGMLVGLVAG